MRTIGIVWNSIDFVGSCCVDLSFELNFAANHLRMLGEKERELA